MIPFLSFACLPAIVFSSPCRIAIHDETTRFILTTHIRLYLHVVYRRLAWVSWLGGAYRGCNDAAPSHLLGPVCQGIRGAGCADNPTCWHGQIKEAHKSGPRTIVERRSSDRALSIWAMVLYHIRCSGMELTPTILWTLTVNLSRDACASNLGQ